MTANWIDPRPEGIHVRSGGFWIDPATPKPCAVITHGHADHARGGHQHVVATPETIAIMEARFGPQPHVTALPYGERVSLEGVTVRLVPAGHVLGSAQVVMEHGGERVVVSGDFKRRPDPTCAPFEPVPCDVWITEATFGLPIFVHPETGSEVAKVIAALEAEPERCVLVGAYALGKAQRVIAELRAAGWDAPIWVHGSMMRLCSLYSDYGVALGDLRHALHAKRGEMAGAIVIAPPSALNDRWSRRLPDPITAMASGWMRVRQRAVQRGVELPLIISDHADWCELTDTCRELAPREVWVTHGREEALVHWCTANGIPARALALVGREDEDD